MLSWEVGQDFAPLLFGYFFLPKVLNDCGLQVRMTSSRHIVFICLRVCVCETIETLHFIFSKDGHNNRQHAVVAALLCGQHLAAAGWTQKFFGNMESFSNLEIWFRRPCSVYLYLSDYIFLFVIRNLNKAQQGGERWGHNLLGNHRYFLQSLQPTRIQRTTWEPRVVRISNCTWTKTKC